MADPTPQEHQEVMATTPRRQLVAYLVPLIAGPLLLLVGAFLILPTQWFARHSQDPWLIGIGYGNDLHDANCQVVLYGDSTAEVGIIPEIIRQRTGFSTCNIAQEQGLRLLSGDFLLDNYLRQNSRPRYLIMLFGSRDYVPEGARIDNPLFEAMTWQMGQKSWWRMAPGLVRDPEEFFRWAYKGMHIALVDSHRPPASVEDLTIRDRTQGYMPLHDFPMSPCTNSINVPPPDRTFVESLRLKYHGAAKHLLFDVMPMPDCDPGAQIFAQRFAGVTDNKVSQLPSRDFLRGGMHVNAEGAALLSGMIAQQILELEGKSGASQ